jgi:choline-sulfatase
MRPSNVVVILSDEHARQALGCYGSPVARTPHLDALAARGTRFASAYCQSPLCVPSRSSLATGRWVHTIGNWDNAKPYTGAEARSWGYRLTAHGHRVVTVGKLHYRAPDDPTGFPEQRLPLHVVEGVGDVNQLLRGDMPVRASGRTYVLEAGRGESDYVRYDTAIADDAARWLREEAPAERRPWALYVGFVCPHFPLIVPDRYFDLYRPDDLPMPVQWKPDEWPHHPALDFRRRQQALDEPIDERALRNAMAAYYGLVTFIDEQVGRVLAGLEEARLAAETRVVYSTDHGEMLGAHGLWWKSVMYEGSAGVPLIVAGPDVPRGKVVGTTAMLVDVYPSVLEAVGVEPDADDAGLPGRSLFALASEPDAARAAFSEYHAVYSANAIYMVRTGRWKYVDYVGDRPQLFDLERDPDETRDLAGEPGHADVVAACARELRALLNPEAVDRRAKADQARRLEAAGGAARILAEGVKVPYTPAPSQFGPGGENP